MHRGTLVCVLVGTRHAHLRLLGGCVGVGGGSGTITSVLFRAAATPKSASRMRPSSFTSRLAACSTALTMPWEVQTAKHRQGQHQNWLLPGVWQGAVAGKGQVVNACTLLYGVAWVSDGTGGLF